jgi:hypothetical protein
MSISARARGMVSEMPEREHDLVERFRVVAEDWADADAAYYMLDNTRTSVRDEIELKLAAAGTNASKAKMLANTSVEYREHVQKTADAKRLANVLRARMDYLRMREKRAERSEIAMMSERKMVRHGT